MTSADEMPKGHEHLPEAIAAARRLRAAELAHEFGYQEFSVIGWASDPEAKYPPYLRERRMVFG